MDARACLARLRSLHGSPLMCMRMHAAPPQMTCACQAACISQRLQLRRHCLQATVVAVSTTTVPPAAAAKGMSSTAMYDFNDPNSAYLNVTFATYPQAFDSLQLDSLMANPSRNCNGYTVSPLSKPLLSRLAPMTVHRQLPHQQPAPAMASWPSTAAAHCL